MLRLTKRDGSPHWQITGTLRGSRVRESTGTDSRSHAEAIIQRRQQEILDRAVYGEAHAATWATAVHLYLDLGGEARYLAPLTERWGTWRLAAITPLEIARAGRELYPGAAPSTLDRQIYTPTVAVLRAAAAAGLCPTPSITRPKVRSRAVDAPPDDWLVALLAAGPRTAWPAGSRGEARWQGARARLTALVLTLTLTGCRVSEAVSITRRDTDLARGTALVRHTKNGDPRLLRLPPELVAALRRLPDAGPDARLLGYASRYTAYQALERAAALAGIDHYGTHQVGRHACAQRMLNDGATLFETQRAIGWKDSRIVARHYGHLEQSRADAALRDAGTKLTQLLPGAGATILKLQRKS